MKALSIRQPWAYLIVNGIKDVENRTWHTDFRGRIYVHAGKSRSDIEGPIVEDLALRLDDQLLGNCLLGMATDSFTLGAIIGEVDIVDCVWNHKSKWRAIGQWQFVLANPVAYTQPIPCRGQLGFFCVSQIENKTDKLETEYSNTFRDR